MQGDIAQLLGSPGGKTRAPTCAALRPSACTPLGQRRRPPQRGIRSARLTAVPCRPFHITETQSRLPRRPGGAPLRSGGLARRDRLGQQPHLLIDNLPESILRPFDCLGPVHCTEMAACKQILTCRYVSTSPSSSSARSTLSTAETHRSA